jgi:carbamoyltransferase
MATNILGISAFYHDSAACLVRDGEIIAAAQEERFTRKKNDASFPRQAADYCVQQAGVTYEELDNVVFYDKPLLKFDRLLETYLAYAPRGYGMFLRGLPVWLKQKLRLPAELDKGFSHRYKGRYTFLEHHESHAASAFYPSPFDEAAILTLDGVGEWATGSIAVGRGHKIEMLQELRFPHSLGLLYSAFTYFTGFKVNSGEYKLMGLAPFGEPIYAQRILDQLLDLKPDGSFSLNQNYFGYCYSDVMTSRRMERLFDGPPRKPESDITQREMDIAASIQAVTEEIVLRIARHAKRITGASNLTLAGGVALNCVANGKILRAGIFDDIWVQPAAGDAGGALGAALFVWHQLCDEPRTSRDHDAQKGSLLGPSYSNAEIERFLDSVGARYTFFADEETLVDEVAGLIARGRVVGHLAGRMEFGPRALGARSILGDPRVTEMQSLMNLKIKFRESFRPFAPAVLRENVHEYFDVRPNQDSPYMLLVAPVKDEHRAQACVSGQRGLARVNEVRSDIPAVTHIDYSARIQTLDEARFPRFHRLVKAFWKRTGCPVMINTSFNVRGEPIVNTPEEAYRCFLATNIDVLVLENFLLLKQDQADLNPPARDAYMRQFTLD